MPTIGTRASASAGAYGFGRSNFLLATYLVVGGGGGGAGCTGSPSSGGGGGAGGYKAGSNLVIPASQTITVGTGGATNTNNATGSSIGTLVVTHGGGVGGPGAIFSPGGNGLSGSSGGGGGTPDGAGGSASYGAEGFAGGNGPPGIAGGGGGAASVGASDGTGYGGNGISNSISGSAVIYSCGGVAGGSGPNPAPTVAPGNGGFGGFNGGFQETAGRNGVVVISYPGTVARATGGTITNPGGTVTVHTFTTSGTFTLL